MVEIQASDSVECLSPARMTYIFNGVWDEITSETPFSLDRFYSMCFGYEYDGRNQEDKRRRSYIWNLILKKIRNNEGLKVYANSLNANHIMKHDTSKLTTIEKVTITWNQIAQFKDQLLRAKLIEKIKSAWELEVTDKYMGFIINEACTLDMGQIKKAGKKYIIVFNKNFTRQDVDNLIESMKNRTKKKAVEDKDLKVVYGPTTGQQTKLFESQEIVSLPKEELDRLHTLIRKQANKISFLIDENQQLKNLLPLLPKERKEAGFINEDELKKFEEMVE